MWGQLEQEGEGGEPAGGEADKSRHLKVFFRETCRILGVAQYPKK